MEEDDSTTTTTTTTTTPPAVRRSGRERKQTTSAYDEALAVAAASAAKRKKRVEEDQTPKSKKVVVDDKDDEDGSDKDEEQQEGEESDMEEEPEEKMDEDESEVEEEEEDQDARVNDDDVNEDDETTYLSEVSTIKTKTPAKKVVSKKGRRGPIQIKASGKTKKGAAKKTTATASDRGGGGGGNKKGGGGSGKGRVTAALTTLAKKVLKSGQETPENSLVAAILASHKKIPGIDSVQPRLPPKCLATQSINTPENMELYPVSAIGSEITPFSPQLEGIARHLIRQVSGGGGANGNNDTGGGTNAMHVQLINFIFRSVGGSLESNISLDTDLDDVTEDEMDEILRVVVEQMMETSTDEILLSADLPMTTSTVTATSPNAGSTSTTTTTMTTPKLGPATYRDIYKEFWYRLGNCILAHTPQTPIASLDEDDDDEEAEEDDISDDGSLSLSLKNNRKRNMSVKKKGVTTASEDFSSNRFQVEMARDLVERLTELVTAGQPDLRMAVTLAIMQIAQACMERTVELETKIQVATRQYKAATQQKSMSKIGALKNLMDTWKRHKAELEELVEGPVLKGVFINRYKDANASIRQQSLEAMEKLCLVRPDLFLIDTYLKYLGWMVSDKDSKVRLAALKGLLAPFLVNEAQRAKNQPGSSRRSASSSNSPYPIEITNMQNVSHKFLGRIVDSVEDSATEVPVQEFAIKLMRCMMEVGLLDDWEDDDGWDQINLKAIDGLASPQVRKDALYFVVDQLDSFDHEVQTSIVGEEKQEEQLEAIAGWIANKLTDGPVPIDSINIHLADLVVQSLLEMPEHQHLVRNWPVMLKAIRNENPQQEQDAEREAIARQRILLRFLTVAAELDSGDTPKTSKTSKKGGWNAKQRQDSRDSLSVALMKELSPLLAAFKSDAIALRDVTKLPLTIPVEVYTLASRKSDLQSLLKTLCQLYLDTTDETVLQNISAVFSQWLEGDHSRISDVKTQVKRLSIGLQDRLMDLFRESEDVGGKPTTPSSKKRRGKKRTPRTGGSSVGSTPPATDIFAASREVELEHSLSMNLLRWSILLTQCPPNLMFERAAADDEDEKEDELEGFFNTISEGTGKRLVERMPVAEERDDGASANGGESKSVMTMPGIWKNEDPNLHVEVAKTVEQSLQVLLKVLAWETAETLDNRPSETIDDMDLDSDDDEQRTLVLGFRERLFKLVCACFDQKPAASEDFEHPDEQQVFAYSVMSVAGRVASDLRTLFPQFWAKAEDPLIRSLALVHKAEVLDAIGGFTGFFQEKEREQKEDEEDDAFFYEGILPLARIVTGNTADYYRKEAALVLRHISGSGKNANEVGLAMTRILKKVVPKRLLETHMTCLRVLFDKWVIDEPEDEFESETPTEEEVEAMQEKEKEHKVIFVSMEQTASKLSSTLGVGKITHAGLKRDLYSFFKEGIIWAFSNGEEYFLGSRLSFLCLIGKYANWVKKDKSQLAEAKDLFLDKQHELRGHPDYGDVHAEDLNHLRAFANLLGIPQRELSLAVDDETTVYTDYTSNVATPTPATASSRRNRTSTAGSTRSRMSGQSTLSPLYEEEDRVDDDDETTEATTPTKRRRLDSSLQSVDNSVASSTSRNTLKSRSRPIDEERDEDSDNEEMDDDSP